MNKTSIIILGFCVLISHIILIIIIANGIPKKAVCIRNICECEKYFDNNKTTCLKYNVVLNYWILNNQNDRMEKIWNRSVIEIKNKNITNNFCPPEQINCWVDSDENILFADLTSTYHILHYAANLLLIIAVSLFFKASSINNTIQNSFYYEEINQ